MRTLTYKEICKLLEIWKCKDEVIVTDFDSACKRCEQLYVNNLLKKQRDRQNELYNIHRYLEICRNASDNKVEYNYKYLCKIIRGEINPKCAKKIKRFLSITKKKYESLRNYHSKGVNKNE